MPFRNYPIQWDHVIFREMKLSVMEVEGKCSCITEAFLTKCKKVRNILYMVCELCIGLHNYIPSSAVIIILNVIFVINRA